MGSGETTLLVLVLACAAEPEPAGHVYTDSLVVDLGVGAPGSRLSADISLQATGSEPLAVVDAALGDPERWSVDTDLGDGLVIDEEYEVLTVSMLPTDEGAFRTTLTLVGDQAPEPWEVVLRAIGRYPCGYVVPVVVDFGDSEPGDEQTSRVFVGECGATTLSVESLTIDAASFEAEATPPLYVLPHAMEEIALTHVTPDGAPAEEATLTFETDDPALTGEVTLYANTGREPDEADDDCEGCADTSSYADDDDHDGFTEFGEPADCDDEDPWSYPGATEDCDDRDNDCDGEVDEDLDCVYVVERTPGEATGCSHLPALAPLWLVPLVLRRR